MPAPLFDDFIASSNVFSIEGKGLKLESAADVQPFVDAIVNIDRLEEIKLSGNTFGVEAGQTIAEVLKGTTYIKIANLSDIFTSRLREEIPLVLTALGNSLKDKEYLTELNLSDNAFGPAGAEPMVDFLTTTRSLQTLKLNNNGLGVGGGTMIAKALLANAERARVENRISSLRIIVCGRNRLEDGSSQALADAFAAHGTLVEVSLPQNGIRPDGIRNITRGLAQNPKLRVLDLQDNTFTERGSVALANALPSWPHLHRLNIGDCLLSKKGGVAIANALNLGNNTALESLNLSYGEIDAEAVAILATAIKSHLPKLAALELNGNHVSADHNAIMSVIAALEEHGHEDALDEIDDEQEEEEDEEDEEDEEAKIVEDAEKEEEKEPVTTVTKEETVVVEKITVELKETHIK